jgi:dTDP-4-amino-4,6-dideoxygalactose transaminase
LQASTGVGHAAALNSGTGAIHLALDLLGVGPGDEVICQSFTFAATANPITYLGAKPVFVDSEPGTWNMDPKALERALRERGSEGERERMPKAIIVVDLYGMPARMDEILAIGERYGIPVIEDAAEALGSQINGQKCGTFGKLNILSFNGNKIITTSGGGALLSDDEELIQKARFLATQARDAAPHYQHSEIGYNYRMSNILAGIGRGQMKVLDDRVKQRRAVHERYFEDLGETFMEFNKGTPPVPPQPEGGQALGKGGSLFSLLKSKSSTGIYFLKEPKGYFSNRWLTTIVVNPEETGGVTREDIRLALAEENIEARPLWKPMHLQPVFEGCEAYTNGVSEWLFEFGLCLPSGSNMSVEQQERVIELIRRVLKIED